MKVNTDSASIERVLSRGVEVVYPSVGKFTEKLQSGTQMTFYLGLDPTGPTLHIGHMIQVRKLAQFQQLGHRVILLIGDFTAQIGDPTGKDKARVPLTHEQVLENAKLYKKQAAKFLKFSNVENPAQLKYNAKWLGKLKFDQIIQIASHFTVQQLLERDMFERRMKDGKPIGLHEFLYPLMQGYDSVAIDVDVEVCGNDQVFNTLVGRDLVKHLLGREKFVVANKLLVDETGMKMGKSEGNMIAMTDSANDMYGKIMAIPDSLIPIHFELLTDIPVSQVKKWETELSPRDWKARLAYEIVKTFHSEKKAKSAEKYFREVFQKREVPLDEIPLRVIKKSQMVVAKEGVITACDLCHMAGLVASNNEVRRLVEQKGLKVNHQPVASADQDFSGQSEFLIQKGKRHFVKIVIEDEMGT